MAFLTNNGESEKDRPEPAPKRGRSTRATRKSRTKDQRTFPVETRNRYDGTHPGVRELALQEAIERGVDPATVRATGPSSFEFIIR